MRDYVTRFVQNGRLVQKYPDQPIHKGDIPYERPYRNCLQAKRIDLLARQNHQGLAFGEALFIWGKRCSDFRSALAFGEFNRAVRVATR